MQMTPATLQKRHELTLFIEQVASHLAPVQAIIAIGSVASGHARPDSDIDAVAFLDPFDQYVLPAEAIWRPSDGTFHSIFHDIEGIQIDFARFDLRQWADPAFAWPEGRLAELAAGWVAFDRTGAVTRLISERTTYTEALRNARLDDAITWLDQHLGEDGPQVRWETLGPLVAHDRLHAAYGYLVQALFAINRRWQPWRNREMPALLALPWLPERFAERVLLALNAPALDRAGYDARVKALNELVAEVTARCQAEGIYGDDPIGDAFVRSHEEPGRAWN